MIKLIGVVKFDPEPKTEKHIKQSEWKKQMCIDFRGELDLFYAKMVEKAYLIHLIRPHRLGHLTIIADRYSDNEKWKLAKERYDGKKVEVWYDPNVRGNDEYWWLRATCKFGDALRKELGLGKPFFPYHITIGSVKESEKEHVNYVLKCRDKFPMY